MKATAMGNNKVCRLEVFVVEWGSKSQRYLFFVKSAFKSVAGFVVVVMWTLLVSKAGMCFAGWIG
jgi:hypothetical protein